ncbi:MAG: acylphosphatase [Candidatus Diapherotrites archaeon]|nr:acylphosphatase [Candidatus Diapherotrites archaeon]
MFSRFEIIVKGKVQKVNFRDVVKELAKNCRLFGFVKNLDNYDEDVMIVIEGENNPLAKFVVLLEELKNGAKQFVSGKGSFLRIEQILVEKKPSTGEFSNFFIIKENFEEELGERMIAAQYYLEKLFEKVNEHKSVTEQFSQKSDENFLMVSNNLSDLSENIFDHKLLTEEHKQVTENFKQESNQNFVKLDITYGKISSILESIDRKLNKL